MAECEKEHGFMDIIKGGLSYISQIISASIFPPIVDGMEIVMKNIERRIIQMERRILRKVYSALIIGLGGVFLIFALFNFLIEFLGWTKTTSYLSIGMIIFVIGLMLKIGEYKR